MPKLTIEGRDAVEIPDGKRLVLAIEKDCGIDILHACGGFARCTTCRVSFIDGEPEKMTRAEKEKLEQQGLEGIRLSCQIQCEHDMMVQPLMRLEGSGRPDPGPEPEKSITPEPEWIRR